MAYVDTAGLYARFGQAEIDSLADRDGDGTPDAGVIDQAAADASAEIDSYLDQRYTVPLSTPPQSVVRVAADIARYRLYDDGPSDEVRRRYDDALEWLRQVAAGRVSLGVETTGSDATVAVVAPSAVFTDEQFARIKGQ